MTLFVQMHRTCDYKLPQFVRKNEIRERISSGRENTNFFRLSLMRKPEPNSLKSAPNVRQVSFTSEITEAIRRSENSISSFAVLLRFE